MQKQRTPNFGLSRKCFPGQMDVRKILQSLNDKTYSPSLLSCGNGEETEIHEDIGTMELQAVATHDSHKKLSRPKSTVNKNILQNPTQRTGNGCLRQTPPELTFDTIPEENEDLAKSDVTKVDVRTVVVDEGGSLFDSEASDLEAEEASHEIVYSAMTQLVQPQEVNLDNLKNKMDVDNKNVPSSLRRLHKFLKIVSHLSFSCVFIYFLYVFIVSV